MTDCGNNLYQLIEPNLWQPTERFFCRNRGTCHVIFSFVYVLRYVNNMDKLWRRIRIKVTDVWIECLQI